MIKRLTGLGVAMVTPFDAKGNIDFNAVSRVFEYLVSGSADYVVVLGTTGESAVLSTEEKDELVRYIVKQNSGRVPIVVGIGGNNTDAVINSIKRFNFQGIDAVLSVTPYYNKPTQRAWNCTIKPLLQPADFPSFCTMYPAGRG